MYINRKFSFSGIFKYYPSAKRYHITALCLTLFLLSAPTQALAFKSYYAPSGSMRPTIKINDYFFAHPYARKDGKPTFSNVMQLFNFNALPSPKRGDVIVFKLNRDPGTTYVKRLVGMPGDKIQMKKGVLHINSTPVKLSKVKEIKDLGLRKYTQYVETLPNGVRYHIWDNQRTGYFDNTKEFLVPKKHYFVLGDNRDNSSDSRNKNNVGFVSEEHLIGYVKSVVWNYNKGQTGSRPMQLP